jgi:hypothetical protein
MNASNKPRRKIGCTVSALAFASDGQAYQRLNLGLMNFWPTLAEWPKRINMFFP